MLPLLTLNPIAALTDTQPYLLASATYLSHRCCTCAPTPSRARPFHLADRGDDAHVPHCPVARRCGISGGGREGVKLVGEAFAYHSLCLSAHTVTGMELVRGRRGGYGGKGVAMGSVSFSFPLSPPSPPFFRGGHMCAHPYCQHLYQCYRHRHHDQLTVAPNILHVTAVALLLLPCRVAAALEAAASARMHLVSGRPAPFWCIVNDNRLG